MLLHNILDGGVVAACQYSGTQYDCSGEDLVAIPTPPVSTTTAWDLSFNQIIVINSGAFDGLTALRQTLYLALNKINVINNGAFDGPSSTALQKLDQWAATRS